MEMAFSQYPLYTHIMLAAVALVSLGCLIVVGRSFISISTAKKLPPVPLFPGSKFPSPFDWGYLTFFCFISAYNAAALIIMPPANTQVDSSQFGMLVGFQLCLYLPFLIRYACLPTQERPVSSFMTKICWVLVGMACILIPINLLDQTGLFDYLAKWTNAPLHQSLIEQFSQGDIAIRCWIAGTAIIMAPFCEEVVYRGFLYNVLKQHGGKWAATLLSAFFFSVIHGAFVQLIPLFLIGVILCLAYEKARSLWLPISLHLLFNALNILDLLLQSK